jgi:fatty acid desaturase
MNILKRALGVLWIVLGMYAVYYLIVNQAIVLWNKGGENIIPAIIYTFILCPMIAGSLGTFGLYSLQGEFDTKEKN